MFNSGVFVFLVLALIVLFWFDSARARELARTRARELCERHQVQFLDESAALAGLRLSSTNEGLRFVRRFHFGYYRDDLGRRQGSLTLIGTRLDSYKFEAHNVIELDAWR